MDSIAFGGDGVKQGKLFPEDEVQVVEQLDLKSAENIAETTITEVDAWCERIEVVGSIRRHRPYVHDIDFVVQPKVGGAGWGQLRGTVFTMMDTKPVFKSGDQIIRALLALSDGKYVQIDFYRCTPDNYGSIKLMRTGSAEHNVWLAKQAIKQNLRWLHTKGLCDGNVVLAGSKEEDIFRFLNLKWIEPELREIGADGKPIWKWEKYWCPYKEK
jgi:DNA polymerase/3'-5' exonuclease PolX